MFRPIALIYAIIPVALAQSSSSSATSSTPTANPLIPSGISSTCSTFLNSLNSDSSLSSCLKTLTTTTSSFAPGTNTTVSTSTVTSALTAFCADSVTSLCPDTLIRPLITDFYSACTPELTTSKNPDVIRLYDTIYAMLPMRTSICSKSDDGNWCVLSSPGSGTKESSSPLTVQQILASLWTTTTGTGSLSRRASQAAIVPNMTTYHNNYLPFLYYTPDLDATTLCTSCLRDILTAYMTYESNVVYGPGLTNSQLLDKQPALYDAVKSKCPANFLSGAVQAAGGLSGGILSSAAVPNVNAEQRTVIALVMGTVMLAITSLF